MYFNKDSLKKTHTSKNKFMFLYNTVQFPRFLAETLIVWYKITKKMRIIILEWSMAD